MYLVDESGLSTLSLLLTIVTMAGTSREGAA